MIGASRFDKFVARSQCSYSSELEELGLTVDTEFLPQRRLSFSQRLLSSLSLGGGTRASSGGSQEVLTSPQRLSREKSLAEPAPGRILYTASSTTPSSGDDSAEAAPRSPSTHSARQLQLLADQSSSIRLPQYLLHRASYDAGNDRLVTNLQPPDTETNTVQILHSLAHSASR